MISDLHLDESNENNNNHLAEENIKLLSSKIRNEVCPNEDIMFILLGDVCDKGKAKGYEIAEGLLNHLKQELQDYNVQFDFIPGNHDLINGNLGYFDKFIHKMGASYSYMKSAAVSKEYGNVNFIFADSTLTRDYKEPGKLNSEAIYSKIKCGMTNILFAHHALTQQSKDEHNCVMNGEEISSQLRRKGIEFYFHSHTHTCNITFSNERVSEISCGSISKNVDDMFGINNQFSVLSIRDGKIVKIDRWIITNDGKEGLAFEELYPEKRKFTDPEQIEKIKYDDVPKPHIERKITCAQNDNKLQTSEESTLDKVIGDNGRILLTGYAGDGKTVALKKLACDLYDTLYFPYFYNLKDYTGEKIYDIIPEKYNDLNPNRLVMIFDGYDEIQEQYRHDFEGKLNSFLDKMPAMRVIISARRNFCKISESGKSSAMRNFDIYNLKQISDEDIVEYLRESKIEPEDFSKAVESSQVGEMIYTPFYLEGLTRIFLSEKGLPSKKDVMEKMIERRFLNDDEKFSNIDLSEIKNKHLNCLENIAFAMQLMHKKQISDYEYQEFFQAEQRKLVKPSGLFSFSNGIWEFAHNNFREYLAAKHLEKMTVDEMLKYCCVGNEVKPSWANTFGYILGLSDDVDLKKWAVENACETLAKYNPDNIDKSERLEIFKRVFKKYETNHTYSYEGLCSESELADFACSIRGINYLIDKVHSPANKFSLHNALRILRHFPKTCGRQTLIRECLLNFCKGYPKNSSYNCRCAIHAICHLELYNSDVTKQLMILFEKSEDDFIRTGMYEYLVYTNEQDKYVQFFLDGIRFIDRCSGKRIANESWTLLQGLTAMSSPKSISLILDWFCNSKKSNFYNDDQVFSELCSKCSKLYLDGSHELFDIMYECWTWAATQGSHKKISAVSEFFKKTNSYGNAVRKFVNSKGLQGFDNWIIINSYPEILEILEHLYIEDKLPDRSTFSDFVRCNCSCNIYNKFAQTISEVEGKTLPELPPPPDYKKERHNTALEYLSYLFDENKYRMAINNLLLKHGNDNLMMEELIESPFEVDFRSISYKVQFAVKQRLLPKQQIKDFFKLINWREFSIDEIYRLIKNENLQLNEKQKETVVEMVLTECEKGVFDAAVSKDGSISEHIFNLTRFLVLLDISLPKSELANLTRIPWHGFSHKGSSVKYTYLEDMFSKRTLIEQVICDVQNNSVDCFTMESHIDYLRKAQCEDIVDYTQKICLTKMKYEGVKRSAIKYLHDLFGSEFIECEILPHCDRDMIMCIAQMFNDISHKELKSAMERVYSLNPDIDIQTYLITYNSETALKDYLESVRKEKSVPKADGNIIGGTNEAISCISDLKMIPLLEELSVVTFDPNFEDREFGSLRNSLYKAYVNCTRSNPKYVLQSVDNLFKICKTEYDFTFCTRLKNDVLYESIKIQDTPLPLIEAKAIVSISN